MRLAAQGFDSPVRQALIGIVSDGPKATVAGKIVYSWVNGVTVL
jgi:hypothetical protein